MRLAGTTFAVLGTGALGRAFARELHVEGAALRLWSRTRAKADQLARELAARGGEARAPAVVDAAAAALEGVDAALVCVHEDALAPLVDALASSVRAARPGAPARVVWHTDGSRGAEVLAPLRGAGLATGRLHPLAALPEGGAGTLRGAWFTTGGEPAALELGRRVVAALDGHELRLRPGADVTLYHAAAALLSGGTVALFDLCAELLEPLAEDPAEARAAAAALLEGTARNVASNGARAALTGPVARGAGELVGAHLARLDRSAPAAAALYRLLGARMLELRAARGGLSPERRAELEKLLLG